MLFYGNNVFVSEKMFNKLDEITFVGFKNYFFYTYLQSFDSSKTGFVRACILNVRMFEFEIRSRVEYIAT